MRRKEMESAGSSSGAAKRPRPRPRPSTSDGSGGDGRGMPTLSADILCAIFALLDYLDLSRCSAVCKSWHTVIQKSTLMRDLYCRKHSIDPGVSDKHVPSITSIKVYLERLAVDDHVSALANGSAEVSQWIAHSERVSQCRMKRGLMATGVGNKALRLWSAESYKCLGDYPVPEIGSLVDFDFDESKIVGLLGSQLCIWRQNGKRSLFQPCGGTPSRGSCMRYADPEAVIGCEDGRARIFDMYSGSCSRIIRIHSGPITCLALDEQYILSGSSSGKIILTDLASGQWVSSLRSHFSPLGITNLCFSMRSHLVFAGSTAGYCHCWDLRTLRPLWETRISSNVTYTINHLSADTSTLTAGGIDGVLRILDQSSGEVISQYIAGGGNTTSISNERLGVVEKRKATVLSQATRIDSLPKSTRPSITCLAVGLRKIVTTHNEKYIRVWNFSNS